MAGQSISEVAARLQEDDPEFLTLYREVKDRTVVGSNCCYMIYSLARRAQEVLGSFAEVGAYRGGSARLIARAVPDRTLHVFDTFTGLPDTAEDECDHRPGEFGDTSPEAVREYLKDCPNVRLYAGMFPATAAPIEDEKFAFVFVDTDIYRSVRDSIEFFFPRLVKGGIMLFDDYGWWKCPGVKRAVDEFAAAKAAEAVLRTHAGTLDQAVLVKGRDPSEVPGYFPFCRCG